jgi:DNA-binding NtrC family response regulator
VSPVGGFDFLEFPTFGVSSRFASPTITYLERPPTKRVPSVRPGNGHSADPSDSTIGATDAAVPHQQSDGRSVYRVLVIEADSGLRAGLAAVLEQEGFRVETCARGDDGLLRLREGRFDAAVVGTRLPGVSGLDILSRIDPLETDARIVAVAEEGDVKGAVEAMHRGAVHCLARPVQTDELLEAVARAAVEAGRRRTLRRREEGEDDLRVPIIGRSPAIRRTLQLVRRVAASRSTVLVTGETGTGKELIARAIHEISPRSEAPFVAVVCSALPESLLEAELFGHRKGSFTGAHADRPGLVEEAHGGTLFLDELATIPPDIQVKLLRVLEERRIRRVGGGGMVPVDFRLVAATNEDLEEAVEEGRFREDFFYRLNVFPIRVPPLRERKEDIPLLAEHFRRRFADENDVEAPAIFPETLVRMQEYSWPGNVRELEHFVERAMLIYAGQPAIRFEPTTRRGQGRAGDLLRRAEDESWDLDRLEREYILRILEEEGGNRTRAAEILGVHRRTLARRMARYRARRRPPR